MFGLLQKLVRRNGPMVHTKDTEHVWEPIRKGFEASGPFVCRCGALGTKSLKVGKRSINLSPGGVDVIRWTGGSTDPQITGDIGMNVTSGRPKLLVGGRIRGVGMSDDYGNVKGRGAYGAPNSTTIYTYGGLPTPTVEGIPSIFRLPGIGSGISYSTIVIPGIDAGWISPSFDVTRREFNCRFEACFFHNTPTASRTWIGLFSGDPMGSPNPAGLHLAALRHDTSVGDTTWKFCVKDGSTLTVVDSGLAATAGGWYIKIDMNDFDLNVQFSIGGMGRTIAPTTFQVPAVPGSSQNLGYCFQTRNLDPTIKTISIITMAISEIAPLE